MIQSASPSDSIRFLQINLRHGRLAAAALSQTMLDHNIDVALVQEPYAYRGSSKGPLLIPNLPDTHEALHRLDANHHFGALIIAKKSLRCRLLPDLSSNHVSAALLELDGVAILLLSIYLRPALPSLEAEFLPILAKSSALLSRSIIGADLNAKNPLWNSPCLNIRGRELESLLARYPLNIANLPIADLPFTPPETSFIDVTLVGNAIPYQNWLYPDIPTLSDHPFIYYEVAVKCARPARHKRFFNSLPPLANIDKSKFQSLLRSAMVRRQHSSLPLVTPTPASIDDAVYLLVELISVSARSSRLPSPPHSAAGRMPWWNDELACLRSATRKSRKKNGSTALLWRKCGAE